MTEEALRAAGYQAPTLSADKGAELDALQVSNDMARYLDAVAEYNRLMDDRKTIRYRASVVIANFWHKCWGGIILMIATTCLALGLCAGEWRTAEITAYCPCALCCGTADHLTANNTNTDRVPYAFASDRSLPFGTSIYVPAGLGVLDRVRADNRWFSVDDRGGALDSERRKNGVLRLDLRVRHHKWAVAFGRRALPVFISRSPL